MSRIFFVAFCALLIAAALASANIDGAKKEGSLVLYTSMTVDQAQKHNDACRSKYPFLQVNMFRAVSERRLTKSITETQAGRFDVDQIADNTRMVKHHKVTVGDDYNKYCQQFSNIFGAPKQ